MGMRCLCSGPQGRDGWGFRTQFGAPAAGDGPPKTVRANGIYFGYRLRRV